MLPRTELNVDITNIDSGTSHNKALDVIVSNGEYIVEINNCLVTVSKEGLIELINFEDETIKELEDEYKRVELELGKLLEKSHSNDRYDEGLLMGMRSALRLSIAIAKSNK